MEIVKQQVDDLNVVLKVKIAEADYSDRYSKALKKYQKKVDLPGFRAGKVPVEIVKKRFGTHILVEEINDMLSESLHKYISDNKIDILGNPLPKDGANIDFDHQKEFEFEYELGLAPVLNIELSGKEKFPYYTIKTDESLVDKRIEYFRKHYGQVTHPEVSEKNDILVGDFTEADKDGNIVPGGFFRTTLIDIAKLTNAQNQAKLTGLKKEDKTLLENLADDAKYIFEILELPEEKLKNLRLQFRLKNLSRIAEAEVNQELFDKIYGPGKVANAEEFRNKIREEFSVMYTADADKKFLNDVIESLMKNQSLTLPESFLKRYLLLTNKEKVTPEQIDKEYHQYSDALRWKLIENHILKTHKLAVTSEEVDAFTTDYVKMNLVRYGMQNPEEAVVKEQVKRILSDQKQVESIYSRLYDQKLIDLFKSIFTLEKKELSHDEFFKQEQHTHSH